HAERVLGARIIEIDGNTDFSRDAVLAGGAELIVYGEILTLQGTAPLRSVARRRPEIGRRLMSLLRRRRDHPPRLNPILARLAAADTSLFAAPAASAPASSTCFSVWKSAWWSSSSTRIPQSSKGHASSILTC